MFGCDWQTTSMVTRPALFKKPQFDWLKYKTLLTSREVSSCPILDNPQKQPLMWIPSSQVSIDCSRILYKRYHTVCNFFVTYFFREYNMHQYASIVYFSFLLSRIPLFTHSFFNEHLSYFQFWAITKKAGIDITVPGFWWTHVFNSLR